jgi:two-component system, OmpR family, sensor histidine kinase KdpD
VAALPLPQLTPWKARGGLFHTRLRATLLHSAAVVALITAITFLFFRIIPVNATTAGFAYLIAVLVIAAGWGLPESLLASILSVLCFNFFFFEPVGTFNIAEPQNWVALFAFLATAIIASELSVRARQRAREAVDRQREMERLYALSRAILLTDPGNSAARQISERIVEIFDLRAAALYDSLTGEIHYGGPENFAGIEAPLRQGAAPGSTPRNENGTLIVPIELGGPPTGTLAIYPAAMSEAAIHALSNLVGIGLERERGQQAASRAEAARQSQELKSTLLDAIAHEFKTPLTTIKASATAMLAAPSALSDEQSELASVVDDEVDRLSRLVTQAIQMARLEAGKIQLNKELCEVESLIRPVLLEMKSQMEERPVDVRLVAGLPSVFVDGELIRLVIRQLVDNAIRYSPPGSGLAIRAEKLGERLILSVADRGPGIPERERAKIFEKFYRSPHTHQHVTGSGMGLAISREILEAHHGEIKVASAPGGGSTFSICLPLDGLEKAI